VPTATPTPVPTATPSAVAQTPAPQPLVTAGAAPTGPPPATLTALAPVSARRGAVVTLEIRGSGFRPDHKLRVLRGGHEVPGIRVTKLTLVAADHIKVSLYLGADVGLGSYSVVLVDSTGAFGESLSFEVVL
jgi:hypothetical protein